MLLAQNVTIVPYSPMNKSGHEGCYQMHADALALLKEQERAIKYQSDRLDELLDKQEPRVLTLEEVIAHYSLPPVFVDDFGAQEDYYEDIQPLYFDFPYDEYPWIVHWRRHAQVARYLDEWRETYNKKWRCWTAKPTEEQRKAVEWNED